MWKIFQKFPPHRLEDINVTKLVPYKILWLHVSKNVFFQKFGTCPRNGSFVAISVKYSQKPLVVKEGLVLVEIIAP